MFPHAIHAILRVGRNLPLYNNGGWIRGGICCLPLYNNRGVGFVVGSVASLFTTIVVGLVVGLVVGSGVVASLLAVPGFCGKKVYKKTGDTK